MDKKTYLLVLTIIIVVIIFVYYYYYKNDYTKYTNLITPPPEIKTKYPLTEQAIMLNFPKDYTTPYSIDIYNSLLSNNLNKSKLKNVLNSYPNSTDPFDLNCYVLHTPVFIPDKLTIQGNYIDQQKGKVISNLYEYEDYYDIIGAYFFNNFNYFLNYDSQVYYYDKIKEIVIDSKDLTKIFSNLKADNSNNQSFSFIEGTMPITLDKFVPKITMFLFYGLGVNISSKYVYQNMLSKC